MAPALADTAMVQAEEQQARQCDPCLRAYYRIRSHICRYIDIGIHNIMQICRIYMFIHLSIYPSIYLSICLSIYLSTYLSICPSIHLSLSLSLSFSLSSISDLSRVYIYISLSLSLSVCLSPNLSPHSPEPQPVDNCPEGQPWRTRGLQPLHKQGTGACLCQKGFEDRVSKIGP